MLFRSIQGNITIVAAIIGAAYVIGGGVYMGYLIYQGFKEDEEDTELSRIERSVLRTESTSTSRLEIQESVRRDLCSVIEDNCSEIEDNPEKNVLDERIDDIIKDINKRLGSSLQITKIFMEPECVACYGKPNVVLIPCGHCSLCTDCFKRHARIKRKCPVCRGNIYRYIEVNPSS